MSFEVLLFVIINILMVFNNDLKKILVNETFRAYWIVPILVVGIPLFIGGINPDYYLPSLLVIPSIFYVILFSISLIGLNHKKDVKPI